MDGMGRRDGSGMGLMRVGDTFGEDAGQLLDGGVWCGPEDAVC